jgi:hypothetical protein
MVDVINDDDDDDKMTIIGPYNEMLNTLFEYINRNNKLRSR